MITRPGRNFSNYFHSLVCSSIGSRIETNMDEVAITESPDGEVVPRQSTLSLVFSLKGFEEAFVVHGFGEVDMGKL